jgi:hypothetical protein
MGVTCVGNSSAICDVLFCLAENSDIGTFT